MIATDAPTAARPKAIRIATYAVTGTFCALMLVSALVFLRGSDEIVRSLRALGYPDYLRTFLGVAKLAGVIALVAPRVPRTLREWAYAGFACDLAGALVSHACVGASVGDIARVMLAFALLFASYALRRALADREV
jgi:hypothetical protein